MDPYKNFETVIEDLVLPLQKQHPDWLRLDGTSSKGNRNVFAKFLYLNRTWRINSDTHVSELMKAYHSIKSGMEPFEIKKTSRGGRPCLDLTKEIASKPKFLFIYEI